MPRCVQLARYEQQMPVLAFHARAWRAARVSAVRGRWQFAGAVRSRQRVSVAGGKRTRAAEMSEVSCRGEAVRGL